MGRVDEAYRGARLLRDGSALRRRVNLPSCRPPVVAGLTRRLRYLGVMSSRSRIPAVAARFSTRRGAAVHPLQRRLDALGLSSFTGFFSNPVTAENGGSRYAYSADLNEIEAFLNQARRSKA
jgi:hypothetical protein